MYTEYNNPSFCVYLDSESSSQGTPLKATADHDTSQEASMLSSPQKVSTPQTSDKHDDSREEDKIHDDVVSLVQDLDTSADLCASQGGTDSNTSLKTTNSEALGCTDTNSCGKSCCRPDLRFYGNEKTHTQMCGATSEYIEEDCEKSPVTASEAFGYLHSNIDRKKLKMPNSDTDSSELKVGDIGRSPVLLDNHSNMLNGGEAELESGLTNTDISEDLAPGSSNDSSVFKAEDIDNSPIHIDSPGKVVDTSIEQVKDGLTNFDFNSNKIANELKVGNTEEICETGRQENENELKRGLTNADGTRNSMASDTVSDKQKAANNNESPLPLDIQREKINERNDELKDILNEIDCNSNDMAWSSVAGEQKTEKSTLDGDLSDQQLFSAATDIRDHQYEREEKISIDHEHNQRYPAKEWTPSTGVDKIEKEAKRQRESISPSNDLQLADEMESKSVTGQSFTDTRGNEFVDIDGSVVIDETEDCMSPVKHRKQFLPREDQERLESEHAVKRSASTPKPDRSQIKAKNMFEGNFYGDARHKDESLLRVAFQVGVPSIYLMSLCNSTR